MRCSQCQNKSIIELQHGSVCQHHFLSYYEEKVFKTLKKYQMIAPEDKICVACSGGKDSQTVLHLTKKYLQEQRLNNEIFALAIDEGIKSYRSKTLKDLKLFCKQEKVKLIVVSSKEEFGYTLDQAIKRIKKKGLTNKPCHLCGVWRRYLINKYARKNKATKLITGHNLDDEAQAVVMNIFKDNASFSAHLGPISGIKEHAQFVQRVKPLYFCTEKEDKLYSLIKNFPVSFIECPYAEEGYRAKVRDMLNQFESQYHGTKQGVINSFLHVLPLIKEKELNDNDKPLRSCSKCGEPANQEVCQACKIMEMLR